MFSVVNTISSQVLLEGYAFETGNRGYLNQVLVEIRDASNKEVLATSLSDLDGKFEMNVGGSGKYLLSATKNMFDKTEMEVSSDGKSKLFVKLEMQRSPGYLFEITLAEKRDDPDQAVNAITNSLIEVYNNTTEEEVLVLKDYMDPEFALNLIKGNHYTILIRKDKYLSKRMEAYVDVKGCILCFEGVGDVRPGVTDNLTEGNEMGTLLANVEMEIVYKGKKIELQNIYYDYGKSTLRKDALEELEKVATFLSDNPRLTVELGSHTDSRGDKIANNKLSRARAKSAFDYLVKEGGVKRTNISYKGYGESQLVNRCTDGVECTDYEHQLNRRTELKVVGISDEVDPRSLKRMKNDEKMEAMIMSMDQEQIQIPAGGELPEDLKKQLQEQESALDKNGKQNNEDGNESIESNTEPLAMESNAAVEETVTEIAVESVGTVVDKSVESGDETGVVKETRMDMPIDAVDDKEAEVQTGEVEGRMDGIIPTESKDIFTGYKILLSESSESIPSLSGMFGRMADSVVEVKDETGMYQYFYGKFEDLELAKTMLGSDDLKMFPSSKIVAFKEGIRISN